MKKFLIAILLLGAIVVITGCNNTTIDRNMAPEPSKTIVDVKSNSPSIQKQETPEPSNKPKATTTTSPQKLYTEPPQEPSVDNTIIRENYEKLVMEEYALEIDKLGESPLEVIDCEYCDGGKYLHEGEFSCEGKGYTITKMMALDGTFYDQKFPCFICNQTGYVDCYSCSKSGYKSNPDYKAYLKSLDKIEKYYSDLLNSYTPADTPSPLAPGEFESNPSSTFVTCIRCKGIGITPCGGCNGSGISHYNTVWGGDSSDPGYQQAVPCIICAGRKTTNCDLCLGVGGYTEYN